MGLLELSVIRVTAESDVTFAADIAKRKEINNEEDGPQDRALMPTGALCLSESRSQSPTAVERQREMPSQLLAPATL